MPRFNLEDYEPVEDRLAKFWSDFPDGRVHTDLVAYSSSQFIVRAAIYRDATDAEPWATGFAEEVVSERGVNATSALENCETSALGRALANAGYATKGKRPSREEMAKVQRREAQAQAPALDDAQVAQLVAVIQDVPAMDDEQLKQAWHANTDVLGVAVQVSGNAVTLREAILERKATLEAGAA